MLPIGCQLMPVDLNEFGGLTIAAALNCGAIAKPGAMVVIVLKNGHDATIVPTVQSLRTLATGHVQ
jgi:hypothetical protein